MRPVQTAVLDAEMCREGAVALQEMSNYKLNIDLNADQLHKESDHWAIE